MNLKKIKQDFLKQTQKEPDKHYATQTLKQEGYTRNKCNNCNKNFWSTTKNNTCGAPECSGGFKFINQTPAKQKLTYKEIWKNFSKQLQKQNYTPIQRYPVAARWRDDTDFVQASIYNFQPAVVSGEVEPPAKQLTVPQPCLRFNDIDNVGITGSHYTGFVMIGQHAFVQQNEWNQEKYFQDWHNWFTKGMKIPKEQLTYHEDTWGGGGNLGPCMEVFSKGLELGNQVYMKYKITPQGQTKELKLKVLDMGMGQERNAWFTGETPTSYETTFPTVIKTLKQKTGIKTNQEIIKKFLPYSSYLNADEVENLDKTWQHISKQTKTPIKELQQEIIPLSGIYSIAEHLRTLLIAINDGIMPSNTSGGYNLRVILRRTLQINQKYQWNIDIQKIIQQHAQYLKEQYPELTQNLDDVNEIIKVEEKKYKETTHKATYIINHKLKNKNITTNDLIELYDNQGITPEQINTTLKTNIKIPDNFYALVAEKHEKNKPEKTTPKNLVEFKTEQPTKALYYDDYKKVKFTAKVKETKNDKILLEETHFFPTSGGQQHDTGTINNEKVIDVYKQGNLIIHQMEKPTKLKTNQEVNCEINWERRKQLTQHHTATHLIGRVCKNLLGNHIWQSGTSKQENKARLDMTHYQNLTEQQTQQIEKTANQIIKKDLKVIKNFQPKHEAEKKYGFSIYQGGLTPGKNLRIVEIENYDVEACGGTHLNTTSEIGEIKIINTRKLQEGIIRIEYVAGKALQKIKQQIQQQTQEIATLLNCETNQIPGRAKELFQKWKQTKKNQPINKKLTSTETHQGDTIKETAKILSTSKENITKTIKRFLKDLEK